MICGPDGGAHSRVVDEIHVAVVHRLALLGVPTGLDSPILIAGEGSTDPKFKPKNVR